VHLPGEVRDVGAGRHRHRQRRIERVAGRHPPGAFHHRQNAVIVSGNRGPDRSVEPVKDLAMRLKTVQFLALTLTALVLVPVGAHLFELPNKIDLAREPYFIVQGIYRGWALFGIVLLPALVATLALALMLRRQRLPFALAAAAFLGIAATLAIFFTWTYPANVATANWTTVPPDWETLRTQWEYAHATNAVITFAAFCALVLSTLATRPQPG
jgi:hypothetical protein